MECIFYRKSKGYAQPQWRYIQKHRRTGTMDQRTCHYGFLLYPYQQGCRPHSAGDSTSYGQDICLLYRPGRREVLPFHSVLHLCQLRFCRTVVQQSRYTYMEWTKPRRHFYHRPCCIRDTNTYPHYTRTACRRRNKIHFK